MTALLNEPIDYQITLNKERLDAYYHSLGTSFNEQLNKYKNQECLCVHMQNLIATYGEQTIHNFLEQYCKAG